MEETILRGLISGAFAGLSVDLTLYPIDTIKTRLQSSQGFNASGGFRNIYRGMSSVVIGSAPSSALFFSTYSSVKHIVKSESPLASSFAAIVAETVACIVRVPTELVKQRAQAENDRPIIAICRDIYKNEGLCGFYRGYSSTVGREIPFSFIEYPLWELLKQQISSLFGIPYSPFISATCGSAAGSVAAAITTPLDVTKTRIMLNEEKNPPGVILTLRNIAREGGVKLLYSGVLPRTLWMGIGGFIYFGAYELMMKITFWLYPKVV
ncbi:unnamed protein product [Dracunculus medinensis]|uniref:S-adenosylmethionine mitochondrial carrier protein n=1 Tax=Dracunculus medinensis TaxID=318479 RepID=A0A0N4UJM1_DRAME|nr:unnamed protein product [Dracunculus medinensis]